jgi:hypothetical protein
MNFYLYHEFVALGILELRSAVSGSCTFGASSHSAERVRSNLNAHPRSLFISREQTRFSIAERPAVTLPLKYYRLESIICRAVWFWPSRQVFFLPPRRQGRQEERQDVMFWRSKASFHRQPVKAKVALACSQSFLSPACP